VLVSGGFTYFTRLVAAELGMDFVRSNELEIMMAPSPAAS
jgi:phosphoserine phosphatase